jgi:hypothetical protein
MKNTVFLWAILAVSIGLAQDKPSAVGNWKLDIAQSEFGSDPAPKSVWGTISADRPQMMSYHVNSVDDKGNRSTFSWSGPEDGSMHPMMMNGKPVGQQSVKKESDGTIVRHGEDPTDGSRFDARGSLSPDGTTFTDQITEKSKDGKESIQKQVWHRVGGANRKPAS